MCVFGVSERGHQEENGQQAIMKKDRSSLMRKKSLDLANLN